MQNCILLTVMCCFHINVVLRYLSLHAHISYEKFELGNMSQRRKISRICALWKRTLESGRGRLLVRLKRLTSLIRVDHERKIRNRRQRTDTGKHSFVNRTVRIWNRSPANILGILPCKPNAFRKRGRKLIDVLNWRYCEYVENYQINEVKWSVVQWRGVNQGVPWKVFMGGVVKRSEDHVKIGVQYLWSNNIRN
jgi:hypothetical protein